jgi:hypothetical protein
MGNEMAETAREWRAHSARTRQKHTLSAGFAGYSTRPEVKLHGVPNNPRLVDKLDIVWGMELKRHPAEVTSAQVKAGLFCDLSQNVHRSTGKLNGCTLCTSSCIYSFEKDCVLDGEDAMLLQGWPLDVAASDELSSAEKQELAGEGFHLPSFALVASAFYMNPWGSWWKDR